VIVRITTCKNFKNQQESDASCLKKRALSTCFEQLKPWYWTTSASQADEMMLLRVQCSMFFLQHKRCGSERCNLHRSRGNSVCDFAAQADSMNVAVKPVQRKPFFKSNGF
jgi:hypothetical protein